MTVHGIFQVALAGALATALAAGPGSGVADRAPDGGGAGGPGARVAAPDRALPDTVFSVARGSRLVLENLEGEVRVDTWAEPRVRIETARDEDVGFRIEGGERRVVRPRSPRDLDRSHEYRVTVPAWIAVTVQGRSLDVAVDGVEGGVEVRTISGDVTIRGARGVIRAHTVEGEIVVEDSRGEIRLHSLGDDVRVARTSGRIQVDATDGDIRLLELDAEAVRATTMDGEIEFSGRIRNGGGYALTTHDGDIGVTVLGDLGAQVSVSTFDGSFESEFPVVTERYQGGRELRFTVGGGGAELQLRAFDGDIRLARGR